MDVYGFNLSSEQYTAGVVTLSDPGDGVPTSLNVIQIGWEVSVILTCSSSHAYSIRYICLMFASNVVLGSAKVLRRFTHTFRWFVDGE